MTTLEKKLFCGFTPVLVQAGERLKAKDSRRESKNMKLKMFRYWG